jgi:hypothetical protein
VKAKLDEIVGELLDAGISLGAARGIFHDNYVAAALRRTNDDVTAAAELLGVHRNSVHNFIRARPRIKEAMLRKQRRTVLRCDNRNRNGDNNRRK